MQENTNKVKEFYSKYKHYVWAAVACVVLVAVLLVFALTQGEHKREEPEDTQSPVTTEENESSQTEINLDGELQKDADEEIVTLFNNYYKAYADGDFASLELLASPVTENEKSFITTFAAYYESYQNLECYSIQASENAYFVSVCYDLKFYDIDTLAPGMDFFYVERDGKGNLYINNVYANYNFNFMEQEFDASIYSMILAYEQRDEVTALQQDVQSRYDEAVASDEKLANMVGATLRNAISQWRASVTAQDTQEPGGESDTQTQEPGGESDTQTPDSSESEAPEGSNEPDNSENSETESSSESNEASNDGNSSNTSYQVRTKDVCNIRASASSDSELIGQIGEGAQLTAIGTEGNWTKIQFSGGEGYIRSDLLEKL